MIASARISLDGLVRLTWMMSAALLVGVGIGLVWWPSAQRIAAIREHARSMYEAANRNDEIVQRSVALERVQGRVEADVRRLSGRASLGALTATTISLLNGEARHYGVVVREIAPDPSGAAPDSKDSLEALDLEIGLHGRFGDLLAFIADVPRHDVLLAVNRVDFKAAGQSSLEHPSLDATLHATIFRLRAPLSSEVR